MFNAKSNYAKKSIAPSNLQKSAWMPEYVCCEAVSGCSPDFYLNGKIAKEKPGVPTGGLIPFDLMEGGGENIKYNYNTGLFEVLLGGLYFFSWGFSVAPAPGLKTVQINLEQVPAPYHFSGLATAAGVSVVNCGSYIVNAAMGESYGFVNRSDAPVDIPDPGPGFYAGNVSVFRLA